LDDSGSGSIRPSDSGPGCTARGHGHESARRDRNRTAGMADSEQISPDRPVVRLGASLEGSRPCPSDRLGSRLAGPSGVAAAIRDSESLASLSCRVNRPAGRTVQKQRGQGPAARTSDRFSRARHRPGPVGPSGRPAAGCVASGRRVCCACGYRPPANAACKRSCEFRLLMHADAARELGAGACSADSSLSLRRSRAKWGIVPTHRGPRQHAATEGAVANSGRNSGSVPDEREKMDRLSAWVAN
jgi:hypothetical protein